MAKQKVGPIFAIENIVMLISLILIFIILCVNPFSLLSLVEPYSRSLHEICLQKIQNGHRAEEQLTSIYSALLCGERLPEGAMKKTFIALGLIHLMVISGAHLIFLEKTWNLLPSFRFKNVLLSLFLLTYSMSAGLRPPVLRALFSLLLSKVNKEMKLFWSPYFRVQISGLLCLLCHSAWFDSLSLQLSWLASMGMSNYRLCRLKSCALTFLLILPIVSQWGGAHPFSILLNWIIAPLASCLLLPLSLFTIPFPFLRPWTDKLWEYLLLLMGRLKPLMENKGIELPWSLSSFQIWIYICICFIVLELYFVYSLRRDCEQTMEDPNE